MVDIRIEEIRSLLPRAMLSDWVRLGARLVRLLRDHHHPDAHEAVLSRLLAQAQASAALREQRRLRVPRPTYPAQLPITARRDDIIQAIRDHQVVVVAGETGSGKTTQLPKMCLEAGLGIEGKIGCTQPRRVAALSISRRIADELGVEWGQEVGCKIRFDDRSSPQTYLKLMTDGILLAETQGDPLLSEYNAIIIDEAHERSLNIDFLLGYLKGLLVKRPDLKLMITSATIDTEAFSQAFNRAPVLEVSGRLYPVEVVYAPLDVQTEEAGEMTYIDAAVRAAEQALFEPGSGDVLIFMPGERDIRETGDLLKSRYGAEVEIIPLFGRLSSGDQQRVFAPSPRRKVVVATNIAETSLTIPGIRYVIDSGLVRMSRYNPRTRTKRLPIEPISQSSANQRKGRSGRLENGVCIRLFSAEDFAARPPFTQPEIQRANLAEVILRMKAFRLGDIETFPFLNPPTPAAIQGGYQLLQELGALDGERELTPLGRDLARLPIDPTLGRMLLQAQHEHATRELLIIAAGLSIQDPRERPLEQKDAAAAAHRRFADPHSDFLTLLKLWNAVHEQWEALRTQNQRRKFCRANFLSYLRMREWQDLHAQLHEALEDLGTLKLNESNAAYEAIHRSILAGLLAHVGQRTERNLYRGAGNRPVTLFPGSALFDRAEKTKKAKVPAGPKESSRGAKPHQPEWVIAGEIVETSQRFARTVAAIDPAWIEDLGRHLCKMSHHNPHWSAEAGRVLVDEVVTLYGLEVARRKVGYGKINPQEATEIFIRSALVGENLLPEPPQARRAEEETKLSASQLLASVNVEKRKPPAVYRFLEHNRQVRNKIEVWRTRSRHHDLGDLDQALHDFYSRQLQDISSVHELNRLLRDKNSPGFLCATEKDLVGDRDLSFDATAFPDAVAVQGNPVPLSYAYSPGEHHDGVTLKLEPHLAQSLSPASVEWAVPGLREAQVNELLRALPKALRRQLMPLAPKATEIARELEPGGHSLKHDLACFIRERYGVEIPPSAWPENAVPEHLRPRIEVVGRDQQVLGAGRDLNQLRKQLEAKPVPQPTHPPAWSRLTEKWERFGLTAWTFGDLPDRIPLAGGVADDAGMNAAELQLYAWPGLEVEDGQVNLRLFRTQVLAARASRSGVPRLVELSLQKDLAWLEKDLRAVAQFEPLLAGLCSVNELQAAALAHLKQHMVPDAGLPALTAAHFQQAVAEARSRLAGLGTKFLDRLEPILKLRWEIKRRYGAPVAAPAPAKRTLSDLKQLGAPPASTPKAALVPSELEELMPATFLLHIPFDRLEHLPRYLKALLTRAERAALNPVKDQERARQLAPYREAWRKFQGVKLELPEARILVEEFRWMIEEFKVSLFAQELGTPTPISAKRLDQQLERIRAIGVGWAE
jgi:ATP-dependent helicase HrpA